MPRAALLGHAARYPGAVTGPLLIGHRGAPGYRPEHTRASYALAIAQGAGAVEPDVVVSADGVLVIRHENELSTTTDVADRPDFAGRRTTKSIDGLDHVGWFAEDFTWEELATLRCRERIPGIRPASARFDGEEPILRLRDLLRLLDDERSRGREIVPVVELKHATYFAGLGWDLAALLLDELRACGWDGTHRRMVVESFELDVLDRLRAAGFAGERIFLVEASGTPFDQAAALGASAAPYSWWLDEEGLDALVGRVEGISPDKSVILDPDEHGVPRGPSSLVARAHARGLSVFTWTCRPENIFLLRSFHSAGGIAAFGRWREEWAVLREAGLDGVFVDHPDLGQEVFGGV